MAEQPTDLEFRLSPAQTKVLVSAAFSTIYRIGGVVLFLSAVILGLWLDSYKADLSSIRTALSAETAARIADSLRISEREKQDIRDGERLNRHGEMIDELKHRVDRHQQDGHGGHYHEPDRRRR